MVTEKQLLKAIHKHCLNCVGGSRALVKTCAASPDAPEHYTKCALWIYRLGVDSTTTKTENK